MIYDNNYFNDPYQGIPVGGYTQIFEKMLDGSEVRLGVDFLSEASELRKMAKRILFTGPIDEFYGYKFGPLEYRSLRFEHKRFDDTDNYQGVAVVNYTSKDEPYTRSIEHKHFEFGKQPFTIVSYEYSHEWSAGEEPYYPVNDSKNQSRYEQYKTLAQSDSQVVFGGRLGEYKYTDMQDTIIAALKELTNEL